MLLFIPCSIAEDSLGEKDGVIAQFSQCFADDLELFEIIRQELRVIWERVLFVEDCFYHITVIVSSFFDLNFVDDFLLGIDIAAEKSM